MRTRSRHSGNADGSSHHRSSGMGTVSVLVARVVVVAVPVLSCNQLSGEKFAVAEIHARIDAAEHDVGSVRGVIIVDVVFISVRLRCQRRDRASVVRTRRVIHREPRGVAEGPEPRVECRNSGVVRFCPDHSGITCESRGESALITDCAVQDRERITVTLARDRKPIRRRDARDVGAGLELREHNARYHVRHSILPDDGLQCRCGLVIGATYFRGILASGNGCYAEQRKETSHRSSTTRAGITGLSETPVSRENCRTGSQVPMGVRRQPASLFTRISLLARLPRQSASRHAIEHRRYRRANVPERWLADLHFFLRSYRSAREWTAKQPAQHAEVEDARGEGNDSNEHHQNSDWA